MSEPEERCERAPRCQRHHAPETQIAERNHTDALHCIVLPWCQATCALTPIEIARLHAVHSALLNREHTISYFQRFLQQRMYNVQSHAVDTSDGLSCGHDLICQFDHGDYLFRVFLRRCTQLKRAPVITGSFAVAEFLRCKEPKTYMATQWHWYLHRFRWYARLDDLSLQHDRPQPTRFETLHEASMALYIRRSPRSFSTEFSCALIKNRGTENQMYVNASIKCFIHDEEEYSYLSKLKACERLSRTCPLH